MSSHDEGPSSLSPGSPSTSRDLSPGSPPTDSLAGDSTAAPSSPAIMPVNISPPPYEAVLTMLNGISEDNTARINRMSDSLEGLAQICQLSLALSLISISTANTSLSTVNRVLNTVEGIRATADRVNASAVLAIALAEAAMQRARRAEKELERMKRERMFQNIAVCMVLAWVGTAVPFADHALLIFVNHSGWGTKFLTWCMLSLFFLRVVPLAAGFEFTLRRRRGRGHQ